MGLSDFETGEWIMLKLERVSKYYLAGNQVVQALRRINLECKLGEFIAITGESGSGKSTLLNVMSGLDTYEEGIVYFDGRDISHYSVEELEHYRKDFIGYVFQEFNIIESYTVYQNVELALTIQGYGRKQRRARVLELIKRVGLTHVAHQKASRLSGGEKQRTVIARTLAKDYRILMCDEPTGNLNEAAAQGIFQLLRDISRDRLVVVVTHDVRLADRYATRKIRLFDGEIVEDAILAPQAEGSEPADAPKRSGATFGGILSTGIRNVLSAPRKTLLTLVTILFMLVTVLFVYGAGIVERNRAFEADNPFFENPSPTRIILVKDDASAFTDAEIAAIRALDDVRDVFENDIVFDSVFITKLINEETMRYDFHRFRALPSLALESYDLREGRLPEGPGEIVVGDTGLFAIGDELPFANAHLLSPLQTLETDQFVFTVVGLVEEPSTAGDDYVMYLSVEGLDLLALSSVFERSETEFRVTGTEAYELATDTWVTPEDDPDVDTGIRTYAVNFPIWIDIDDELAYSEILTFDMLYFDVCRDFGYKREIRDDLDAGLCDADAFLAGHAIGFRANTTFGNDHEFVPVTVLSTAATDDDQSMKLYMNEETFRSFFGERGHQVTVVVRDAFEGKLVVRNLERLGYDVYYPALIIGPDQAVTLLIRNMLVTALVAVILFAVFFVGYFVLRNLVFSKLKDYLIMRSIGTSRRAVGTVLRIEMAATAVAGGGIVAAFLLVYGERIALLRDLLRYMLWTDYAVLILVVAGVMELMVLQFTRKIFATSVVMALKGAER